MEDHDNQLRNLLNRCREKGIRINAKKCQFRQKSVKFLGHEITEDGLRIDADKVKAVRPQDCICCKLCELRCPDLAIEIELEK